MQIRSYTLDTDVSSSPKEAQSHPYLAQLDLGRNVFMSFFGETKVEAREKAQTWYDNEVARQRRLEAGCHSNTAIAANVAKIANNVAKAIVAAIPSEGRGSHFGGSAWIINKANERRRVPETEAATLLASGQWQRGGPRSTWKKA